MATVRDLRAATRPLQWIARRSRSSPAQWWPAAGGADILKDIVLGAAGLVVAAKALGRRAVAGVDRPRDSLLPGLRRYPTP